MKTLLFPFMILAVIGFLGSAAAHLASLFGLVLPGGKLVWSLHIGIFVVWVPVVLLSSLINRGRPPSKFWKNVLSGCPPWMRYAVYALLVYAIGNFFWFLATSGSQPQPPAGDAPPAVIRGFSGHWLFFYGMAVAVFFSIRRNLGSLFKRPKCPNGHEVSATDAFCPACGDKIGK